MAVLQYRIFVGISHYRISRTRHGWLHLDNHRHGRHKRQHQNRFVPDLDRRSRHEVRAGKGRLLTILDRPDIRRDSRQCEW
jgi:hypothetical protein